MKINLILFTVLSLMLFACQKEENEPHDNKDEFLSELVISPTLSEEKILEKLEGYTSIGTLIINKDVPNFDFLKEIYTIRNLSINGVQLSSFESLSHIDITTRLHVERCNQITSLDGINGMDELSNLFIDNNERLEEIDFGQLREVQEDLRIIMSKETKSILFPVLEKVGANLYLWLGKELEEIYFLKLKTIGEQLNFIGNDKMTSLGNWSLLESVSSIYVRENELLEDISTLIKVRNVNHLYFSQNNIEDFCPLKDAILLNRDIRIGINSRNSNSINRSYFELCP